MRKFLKKIKRLFVGPGLSATKIVSDLRMRGVKIGDNVFIGTGCIILPDTTIGNNVVIDAGTIIASDLPTNSVMIGNPARRLYSCDEYIERNRSRLVSDDAYISDILFCNRAPEQWDELRQGLAEKKYGYDV